MKKEKLIWPITLVIIVLILSFVYYFLQVNKQKNEINKSVSKNQISAIENNDVNIFSKKIECEKYKDQIIKGIKQYNSLQKPEIRDSDNTDEGVINNLYVENNEFKEIFYSPKVNSCVYLESRKTLVKRGENANPNVGDWGISYESYYLIDALTNKEIDFNDGLPFLQIFNRSERFSSEEQADTIIDKYR